VIPFRFCPCRECSLFVWLTGAIQIDFVWRPPSPTQKHALAILYLCVWVLVVSMCAGLEHFVLTTRQIVAPHLAKAVCMLFLVCLPVYLWGLSVPRNAKMGSNGLGEPPKR